LAWSEAGAVAFVTESTSISAKVSFDGCGSLDVVSAALKGRIQSSKEIVQMCCKDTDCLLQCCCGPSHDQSEGKHRPWKQLDGDLEDDKMGLLATVVLGESINEGQEKSLGENHGSKNQASNDQNDSSYEGNISEEVAWLAEAWRIELQTRCVCKHEVQVKDERESSAGQDKRRHQPPELRRELEDPWCIVDYAHATDEAAVDKSGFYKHGRHNCPTDRRCTPEPIHDVDTAATHSENAGRNPKMQ